MRTEPFFHLVHWLIIVTGFAAGPLVFGPASELYGRNAPLWLGYLGFLIFQAPLGVARDAQTVLICRFFAGVFGSAPLAIVGGQNADMLGPVGRGIATAGFSLGVYCGPVAGPILGNILVKHLNWRWTAWITLILGAFFGLVSICTPETAESVILRRKAEKLRIETSDWALHAECEEKPTHLAYFVEKYLAKPVLILIAEPIVKSCCIQLVLPDTANLCQLIIFTAYMSLVYGIMYLTLTLYPYAFQTGRGWESLHATLPFLYMLVGVVLACVIIGAHSVWHGKTLQAGKELAPEQRLHPVVLGSFILPAGECFSEPRVDLVEKR